MQLFPSFLPFPPICSSLDPSPHSSSTTKRLLICSIRDSRVRRRHSKDRLKSVLIGGGGGGGGGRSRARQLVSVKYAGETDEELLDKVELFLLLVVRSLHLEVPPLALQSHRGLGGLVSLADVLAVLVLQVRGKPIV
jgi:hypothetical protein